MAQFALYQYVIIVSTITGLLLYNRLPIYLKWLVGILIITLAGEIIPELKLIKFHGSNHWWYNIFTVIEFIGYSYIFYFTINNSKLSRIIIISLAIYFALAVLNIFLIQGFYRFHTISYRIGALMIVIWCLLYFFQLMKSENKIKLLSNPMFWIATGLFFFYLGFFMYMNAFDYIVYKKLDYDAQLWRVISRSLNTLLYSCILISLIWESKRVKSTNL